VWALFRQPGYINITASDLAMWTSDPITGRFTVNVTAFADNYDLGPPVGINFQRESVDAWVPNAWKHLTGGPWVSAAAQSAFAGLKPQETACTALGQN
jgi:hypothetical protein